MAFTHNTHVFNLDIKRQNSAPLLLVRGDIANKLIVTVTDNGSAVDLTGVPVWAEFLRSDGMRYIQTMDDDDPILVTGATGVVTIPLQNTAFRDGENHMRIMLLNEDQSAALATTSECILRVSTNILSDEAFIAGTEYPLLMSLINAMKNLDATVTVIAPTDDAACTVTLSSGAYHFAFSLPRGAQVTSISQSGGNLVFMLDDEDATTITVPFSISTGNIADGAVTTDKLADNAVTGAKIANNAVSLAKLGKIDGKTILGNNSNAQANVDELTATEVTAMLDEFTGTDGLLPGTKGLVPAPSTTSPGKFLGDDGTWKQVPVMTGATSLADGTPGLAPKPETSDIDADGVKHSYLAADGTWKEPTAQRNLTYAFGDIPANEDITLHNLLCRLGSWHNEINQVASQRSKHNNVLCVGPTGNVKAMPISRFFPRGENDPGYIRYLVENDQHGDIEVGSKVKAWHQYITEMEFDVADHDTFVGSGEKSIVLKAHNAQLYGIMPFSMPQLLLATKQALPAGTYYFNVKNGRYGGTGVECDGSYMFTTTQTIPEGGGIRHTVLGSYAGSYSQADMLGNKIKTYGAAPAHADIETLNLSVYDNSTATYLGQVTAWNAQYLEDTAYASPNYTERNYYGSNRYAHSLIRKWLNSDGAPVGTGDSSLSHWWEPSDEFDMPPASAVATGYGFLYGMEPALVSALGTAKVVCEMPPSERSAGSENTETLNDKVFLFSKTEFYGGTNISVAEGSKLEIYDEAASDDYVHYQGTTARAIYLRSANSNNGACRVRIDKANGGSDQALVTQTYGIVPGMIIKG